MSSDKEALREWIDQLEQILSQLDSINASIAAIHVDIAIAELCQLAEIERANGAIKAA
jgi:prefoldin subunit 5